MPDDIALDMDERSLVEVDVMAWQRELGVTAFHIGCADRDYDIGEVLATLDDAPPTVRRRIAEAIDLPDVERLESPPRRDGPTQVYVLGEVTLTIPEGEVRLTDFSEDRRRYTFVGSDKADTSMDIAPFRSS